MKKQLIFLLGVLIANTSFSQNWREMMNKPDANLYDIQREFNDYWKDKDISEKGNGYKQFKRWEHFAEPRVYPSGNLSQLSLTSKNYSEFLKNSAEQNSAGNKVASSSWTALGPFGALSYPSYPQYVAAGRIDFVRVDPNNSSVLYSGSPTGGLWKSINGGISWTTNSDNLPVIGCSDIAIDPSNSNILYLATGDGNTVYNNSIGILKSTDGGITWNTTGLTYSVSAGRHILRVLVNPLNPQIVIAATNAGIWKSSDGAATWTLSLNQNEKDLEFKPGNPNVVYASGYYGFYRSVDAGTTFSLITNGIPSSGTGGMSIAVTKADSNYVYAISTSTNGGFGGFYQSTDGGTSFASITTTMNILGYTPTSTGGQGSYNLCIDASPTFKNIVVVGGIYPWYTTNAGASWTQLINTGTNPTYIHPDTHDILYGPGGTNIYVANDGGLHNYTSLSLNNVTGNMNIAEIYKIGLSSLTPNLWITGLQDNGSSIHTSSTYSFTLGADGMDCFYDRTNDNNVFGSSQYGGLSKSVNGGMSWTNCGFGFGITGTSAWVAPWHQDPVIANTLYAGFTDLFKSTNLAGSWTSLTPIPGAGTILEFQVAPSNNQVIYVLKSNGSIFKTSNGGVSWANVTGTLPVSVAYPTYLTIDPTDANNVWVTCSGYSAGNKIFVTANGGGTWTNISYNLPNIPANCSVYLSGSNDGIYIGMDVGVYFKDNSMSSWTTYNAGLPNVEISQLQISPATPTKIHAATYGRGVYSVDVLAAPLSSFSVSGTVLCTSNNVVFTDQSVFSPTSWSWTVSPGTGVTMNTSASQNPTVNFANSGTYTVSLMASNGVGAGTVSNQTISINPTPSLVLANPSQTVCVSSYVIFSASGVTSYTWSNGGGNGNLAIYSPTANTTYTVFGSSGNGCTDSKTVSVVFDPCSGINEVSSIEQGILVYPNPNKGSFTIEVSNEAQVMLYNSTGSVILNKKMKSGKSNLDISNYANGIYYLQTSINGKTKVIKVVKEE